MLESLKEEVIRIGRIAQREGMCKHKAGNFSSRDPRTGYLVITPSGIDREELTPEDMVVMDMDARVLEVKKGLRPSSEVLVHIEVYKARPDLFHLAHTHSRYATAFAVLNRPIPAIVNEMMALNNQTYTIPVAKYGRTGSEELAVNVARAMERCDSVLMTAHGSIAGDALSLENAYLKTCYIEELAEVYHHALTANGGKEPPVLPLEEMRAAVYPPQIIFPEEEEAGS